MSDHYPANSYFVMFSEDLCPSCSLLHDLLNPTQSVESHGEFKLNDFSAASRQQGSSAKSSSKCSVCGEIFMAENGKSNHNNPDAGRSFDLERVSIYGSQQSRSNDITDNVIDLVSPDATDSRKCFLEGGNLFMETNSIVLKPECDKSSGFDEDLTIWNKLMDELENDLDAQSTDDSRSNSIGKSKGVSLLATTNSGPSISSTQDLQQQPETGPTLTPENSTDEFPIRYKRPLDDEELEEQRLYKRVARNPATKFLKWGHPIYSRETSKKVTEDEINKAIEQNYTLDETKDRPYMCTVNHLCFRRFLSTQNIENHLFSCFFYIVCPYCGQDFKLLYYLTQHYDFCHKIPKALQNRQIQPTQHFPDMDQYRKSEAERSKNSQFYPLSSRLNCNNNGWGAVSLLKRPNNGELIPASYVNGGHRMPLNRNSLLGTGNYLNQDGLNIYNEPYACSQSQNENYIVPTPGSYVDIEYQTLDQIEVVNDGVGSEVAVQSQSTDLDYQGMACNEEEISSRVGQFDNWTHHNYSSNNDQNINTNDLNVQYHSFSVRSHDSNSSDSDSQSQGPVNVTLVQASAGVDLRKSNHINKTERVINGSGSDVENINQSINLDYQRSSRYQDYNRPMTVRFDEWNCPTNQRVNADKNMMTQKRNLVDYWYQK